MKMKLIKVSKIVALGCLILIETGALTFAADRYPTKPIKILIANSPAGSISVSIRMLASKVQKVLGQPFIMSNNNAGGGSVATGVAAKQKPDGYDLLGCTSTAVIRIPQFRPVPYKYEDFVPLFHYGAMASGLFVKADSPWKTLKEFVEYAKKNPGKVTYGVSGTGTPQHLAMEFISKQEGGIKWTAVPVTGEDNSVPLLGGHVTAGSIGSVYASHVRTGALRLLATHGERRMKDFPDVPTFRESGYDFINETVMMMAAPKGTAPSIVNLLADTFHKQMNDPEFLKYMATSGNEIFYRNPADTKKYLDDAYVRIGKMIKELNVATAKEK